MRSRAPWRAPERDAAGRLRRDAEREQAKRRFLDEWVSAVNAQGGFGKWAWDVALEPADVPTALERQGRA
jgi:type III restriction enzyme